MRKKLEEEKFKLQPQLPISCLRDQVETGRIKIAQLNQEQKNRLIHFYEEQIEKNKQEKEEIKQEIIAIRKKRSYF